MVKAFLVSLTFQHLYSGQGVGADLYISVLNISLQQIPGIRLKFIASKASIFFLENLAVLSQTETQVLPEAAFSTIFSVLFEA